VVVARVYVSSTIADLTEERRAVLDWLRQARHQAVDSYLPDSDSVRDSCLDDIAACDLYVLILGHRYGYQPPQGNPEGLSITQLEFRRAGECGIPRVALLRTSIPDVSLSDLGDRQRLALVSAFRDEVARLVRAAEFTDLKGLIAGLSTGVQGELEKLDSARDATQRAPDDPPHHRPPGQVQPDHGVRAGPNDIPDLAVAAVDNPALAGRHGRHAPPELGRGQRHPVSLVVDRVELEVVDAQRTRQRRTQGGLARTRGAHHRDAPHSRRT
jgi:hypothetical protein